RWTPEANFLAWQPFEGERARELPKATLRLAVQWREAHDPRYLRTGEDLYQEPLAKLQLVLLRQRDPTGQKGGADEMEVVARSTGPALRVLNEAESATYEVALEYAMDDTGYYAVRVEGAAPKSIRPPGVAAVPGLKNRDGEVRPRIFVDVI